MLTSLPTHFFPSLLWTGVQRANYRWGFRDQAGFPTLPPLICPFHFIDQLVACNGGKLTSINYPSLTHHNLPEAGLTFNPKVNTCKHDLDIFPSLQCNRGCGSEQRLSEQGKSPRDLPGLSLPFPSKDAQLWREVISSHCEASRFSTRMYHKCRTQFSNTLQRLIRESIQVFIMFWLPLVRRALRDTQRLVRGNLCSSEGLLLIKLFKWWF